MKTLAAMSLEEWLNTLASTEPVPAGGSVAALTAASAGALAAKMARILARREKDRKRWDALAQRLTACSTRSLALAQTDADAYRHWMVTRDPEARKEAIQIPEEIAALCEEIVETSQELLAPSPPWLRADVEAAIQLAQVAARISRHNAAVNQS